MKRALLVGINYKGSNSELRGCYNDVEKLRGLIPNYASAVLKEPTAIQILEKLTKLVNSDSKHLLFAYSGHGSHIKDIDGDEDDGFDETIVGADSVHITDDLINSLLVGIPRRTKGLLLFDCCYSGSSADLQYRVNEDNNELICNNKVIDADIISISGCTDMQTSADALISNEYNGAMTIAFLETWNITKGKATCFKFVNMMNAWLDQNKFTQRAQLTFSRRGAHNKTLAYYIPQNE